MLHMEHTSLQQKNKLRSVDGTKQGSSESRAACQESKAKKAFAARDAKSGDVDVAISAGFTACKAFGRLSRQDNLLFKLTSLHERKAKLETVMTHPLQDFADT